MRKPAFCICENKDADQLRGNREADQRLCFRYIDRLVILGSNLPLIATETKNAFKKNIILYICLKKSPQMLLDGKYAKY